MLNLTGCSADKSPSVFYVIRDTVGNLVRLYNGKIVWESERGLKIALNAHLKSQRVKLTDLSYSEKFQAFINNDYIVLYNGCNFYKFDNNIKEFHRIKDIVDFLLEKRIIRIEKISSGL